MELFVLVSLESFFGFSAVELSVLLSLVSPFVLSGFELSFLSSLGVSFSLSVIVSDFCISFVPSLSPKYLPHSSQYQYSIFPSLSCVASTLSTVSYTHLTLPTN